MRWHLNICPSKSTVVTNMKATKMYALKMIPAGLVHPQWLSWLFAFCSCQLLCLAAGNHPFPFSLLLVFPIITTNMFKKYVDSFYKKGQHTDFHGYKFGPELLVTNTKAVTFKWLNIHERCMIKIQLKKRIWKKTKLYYLYEPTYDSISSYSETWRLIIS